MEVNIKNISYSILAEIDFKRSDFALSFVLTNDLKNDKINLAFILPSSKL